MAILIVIKSEAFTTGKGTDLARGMALNTITGEQRSFIGDKEIKVKDIVDVNSTGWASKYHSEKKDIEESKQSFNEYKKLF